MGNERKKVKRDGPKYVCPYCKNYYYMRKEAEECRDRCYQLVIEGNPLPDRKDDKLGDFEDILKKIDDK